MFLHWINVQNYKLIGSQHTLDMEFVATPTLSVIHLKFCFLQLSCYHVKMTQSTNLHGDQKHRKNKLTEVYQWAFNPILMINVWGSYM